MPTSKPRIAITLDQRVYETIERLAHLQGKSRGAVVAELVTAIHEPLMRTVALLDAAQQAPEEVKRGLRGVVESVETQLVGSVGGGLAQVDWLIGRMAKGVHGGRSTREPPPHESPSGSEEIGGGALPRKRPADRSREAGAKPSKRLPTPVPVTRGSGRKKRPKTRGRKGGRS